MNQAARGVIRAALGMPCWQVTWDGQVGLQMDFGAPRLEVFPVRVRKVLPKGALRLAAKRSVHVKGTHWLWISPIAWRIELADGFRVAYNSPYRHRDMACARLGGERLVRVVLRRESVALFEFDLGSRIIARAPRGWKDNPRDRLELWRIHVPRHRGLGVYPQDYFAVGSTRGPDITPVPMVRRVGEESELVVEKQR